MQGTETVGTGISFTLLMLAMNTEIQNKVLEELNAVFPDDEDKDIEMSDLHELTFLEKCLKESLRKLSVIPFIERRVTSEVTLDDGRVVPVGVSLVLSIHNIHSNPKYYPNPEEWNPHNFDEDAIADRPANTFIPFAVGMRQCIAIDGLALYNAEHFKGLLILNGLLTIVVADFLHNQMGMSPRLTGSGYKSAMMSMKIFIARIIRNFKVTTSQPEAKLVHYLTVRCISGYHLKFEKR